MKIRRGQRGRRERVGDKNGRGKGDRGGYPGEEQERGRITGGG